MTALLILFHPGDLSLFELLVSLVSAVVVFGLIFAAPIALIVRLILKLGQSKKNSTE